MSSFAAIPGADSGNGIAVPQIVGVDIGTTNRGIQNFEGRIDGGFVRCCPTSLVKTRFSETHRDSPAMSFYCAWRSLRRFRETHLLPPIQRRGHRRPWVQICRRPHIRGHREKHVVFFDRLALFDLPLSNAAFRHGQSHPRHQYFNSHI